MSHQGGVGLGTQGGVGLGTHASWVFASDAEHRRVLTAFLDRGLREGELVAYFASPPERVGLAGEYLESIGVDVDRLLDEGDLLVAAAEDAYLAGGRFDPDARLRAYRAMFEDASRAGYAGLRVAGEVAWLLEAPEARDDWVGYELRAELMAASLPITALCCYDGRSWDPDSLRLYGGMHSRRVGGDGIGVDSFHLRPAPGGGIAVEGELDFRDATAARSALVAAVAEIARPVLDLSRLAFFDVAAIRAIDAVATELRRVHGWSQIRGASRSFRKIWCLLGLDGGVIGGGERS